MIIIYRDNLFLIFTT